MVDKALHQLNAPKSVRYSAKLLNTLRVETDTNMCMREEEEHPEPSINQRRCVGCATLGSTNCCSICRCVHLHLQEASRHVLLRKLPDDSGNIYIVG